MGDADQAIDLLSDAIDHGFGDRAWLEHQNLLDNARKHPRSLGLLDRLERGSERGLRRLTVPSQVTITG